LRWAPAWQRPQVTTRFAGAMGELGSEAGRIFARRGSPSTGPSQVATKRETELRVEGVAVGGKACPVAGAADGRGLHAESRFCRLQDCVCGVAVGGDGGFILPAAMALRGLHLRSPCRSWRGKLPAGFRDVGLNVGLAGLVMAQDAIAIRDNFGSSRASRPSYAEREPVNRIHVVREHAGQAVLSSLALSPLAFSAGRRAR